MPPQQGEDRHPRLRRAAAAQVRGRAGRGGHASSLAKAAGRPAGSEVCVGDRRADTRVKVSEATPAGDQRLTALGFGARFPAGPVKGLAGVPYVWTVMSSN